MGGSLSSHPGPKAKVGSRLVDRLGWSQAVVVCVGDSHPIHIGFQNVKTTSIVDVVRVDNQDDIGNPYSLAVAASV